MYKRILLATDGSALSKKAHKSAVQLAALMDAQLFAVKVIPRYPVAYFEGAIAIDPATVKQVETQWETDAKKVLESVVALGSAAGVTVKPIVVRSDLIADAVMSAAKKQKCDLIVMASHGRRGIKRLLLGSETQHVLTHSQTPVLVLR
jgi:nucleotide-binding universal stress UspA family protein